MLNLNQCKVHSLGKYHKGYQALKQAHIVVWKIENLLHSTSQDFQRSSNTSSYKRFDKQSELQL
jgi:hypothetical protein